MRISDWSSDVCSSDLRVRLRINVFAQQAEPLLFGRRRLLHGVQQPVAGAPFLFGIGDIVADFAAAQGFRRGATLLLQRFERGVACARDLRELARSEEHTSELQSLMRISYAVFCLKKKTKRK